jgi:hypothetical protein
MKTSAALDAEASKQLQAVYERLWTRNANTGFETQRVNLFRIVLFSFIPLS